MTASRDTAHLSFGDGQTFLGARLASFEEIVAGQVVVSGAPYVARARGFQRSGPRAIRESSAGIGRRLRDAGDDGVLDIPTQRRLILPREAPLVDIGDLNLYPSDVMRSTEGIAGGVAEVVRRGGFSVCLGGDHYAGYPSCLGFCRAAAEARPNVRVGYVHIDGHLDFTDEYATTGLYNNGTNARRISEIDVVVPRNMVWIGIQGPCGTEPMSVIRKNGATVFTSEDIHTLGPAEVGRRAGETAIAGCDFIYLSFDIDVIDAGFASGTGSVTMGAVTPLQLLQILDALATYPIGAMDLVENSPELDPSQRTSMMAAHSLLRLIGPKIFAG